MNDQQIVVLGAGGHALSILDTLERLNLTAAQLLDPMPEKWGTKLEGVPITGPDSWLDNQDPKGFLLVNGVGSVDIPSIRCEVFTKFKSLGFQFMTLVHPSAIVSSKSVLQEGSQVMAGAIIQSGVYLEQNVLINTGVILDHNTSVGAHSHIATGVRISGDVKIGELCHIGTGASLIQGIEIKRNSLVAAGAVVIENVLENSRVAGIPAKAK